MATAYKLLLRRSPDPEGLKYYEGRVDRGFTIDELASSLMNSDEFRKRIVPLLPGELKVGIRRHVLAEEVVPVDLGGYVVCVRASDQDFGRAIIATRDYEPHLRRFLAQSVRPGQVVVDVGANIGCLTFQAARLVGDRGRVIAIEPNPDNVQLLYAGILMNAWANVQVCPCAAWDAPGIMSRQGGASNTYLDARGPPRGGPRVHPAGPSRRGARASGPISISSRWTSKGTSPHAVRGARALIERHRRRS